MFAHKLIVGGESLFSPLLISEPDLHQFSKYGAKLQGYHKYYTFGAYYSIRVIVQNLKFEKRDYVLLPSYLCHTIIEPFQEVGIKFDFYKMKEGLLPDLEDIDRKTKPGLKAVLFIDYFGFSQKEYLANIVTSLQAKGIKVIQDSVHSWLDNEADIYADYCMNSVRKYTPFEASVLFSKAPLKFIPVYKPIKAFLFHKRYAQILRYCHVHYGLFKPDTFLRHLDISNNNYHKDGIIGMLYCNKVLLNRLDFEAMGKDRKIVYKALHTELKLDLVLNVTQDIVPLGMAIYLSDRDKKKIELHKADIHCPLHWLLPKEISTKEHDYSWDLQNHALTLPVNIQLPDLTEYICKLQEVIS